MRLLAAALLLLALAGCLGGNSVTVPGASVVGTAGWHLDCYRTAGWSDPCTTRASVTSGPANENWLAVNPKDPLNVMAGAKDYNPNATDCVWVGLATTHDGGKTWKDQYIGGLLAERNDPTNPLFPYQCNTDPMFAFADDGTLYDVVEVYGQKQPNSTPPDPVGLNSPGSPLVGPNTMFITVSKDGGTTFGPLARVWDGGLPAVLQDRTLIVGNPTSGSVHFIFSQRQDIVGSLANTAVSQVVVSTSRDHGATWGSPLVVSAPEPMFNIPAAITADEEGRVVAFWARSTGPSAPMSDLFAAVSTDDGTSFGVPIHVAAAKLMSKAHADPAQFYVAINPQIAVDRSGGPRQGWLYAVWDDNQTGHLDPRISISKDHGATWSAPAVLTGDPDAHDRFHPAIAVDAWGAVHVTYNDRRYDAANKLLDLSWAIAPDGSNFISFRVTNGSFDGDLGFHQSGVPFIGDYNGLGCSGATCYASFADTRDGRSELAVARLVRG